MCKKAIVTGLVVCGLSMFFFGRGAISYLKTATGRVKESVRSSVPMDFEIDRARRMVKDLVPDIRKSMHVIAKEEVELEQLKKQISQTETRLDKDRADLVRLKNDLGSGKDKFHYVGQNYTAAQVKKDLSHRFERFKTSDATLASLKEIQQVRERSLLAARDKLEAMLAAKRKLEVDVEHLEARLKIVEAAETASDQAVDDTNLSRAKELIADLRTRLDVAERLTNAEGTWQGEIPLSEPESGDIISEVNEYLGIEEGDQVAEAAKPDA